MGQPDIMGASKERRGVMAKNKTVFFCTNCGNETPKWMGRCPSCGAFNTMEEHIEKPVAPGRAKPAPVGNSRKPQRLREVASDGEIRFSTGMGELDRVLGGGAVAGSLVLVGGAPGIGKSTLLLQICNSLCTGRKVLYVSGEESERQLKLRAQRLGVEPDELFILSETRLSDVLEAVDEMQPDILIVDSVQTLYNDANDSSPGSVSQVKDCTMSMMQLSKSNGITVFVWRFGWFFCRSRFCCRRAFCCGLLVGVCFLLIATTDKQNGNR